MKAKNMYDKTSPRESNKPDRRHVLEKDTKSKLDPRTYHGPGEHLSHDYSNKPIPNQNHEGFQFGKNPLKEDSFEKNLIMLEKKERQMAKEKYIKGIQGSDGGCKPYEDRAY